jgi:hypothetical protein
MTTRTRYFVIASLLVLTVGVGTGLVAYYVGFPTSAFSSFGGPEELKYVPRNAEVLAYANVRDIMSSELRQRIKANVPMPENGQREFQDRTGINIETDIDRVVACLEPSTGTDRIPSAGLVVATGRFDQVKIEALMREHRARVEDYKGRQVLWGDANTMHRSSGPSDPFTMTPDQPASDRAFALAFVKPGVVAVGNLQLVKRSIDLDTTGGDNITLNDEVMSLVKSLDAGNNAWALGRFDLLRSRAHLPDQVASQLPAITWFSVSTHVNGGIRGVMRAETRDEESANNLRDVVRGFMALAKMQSGSRPELQTMVQSLELGGTGKTVALSFAVPVEVFDAIGALKRQRDGAHR